MALTFVVVLVTEIAFFEWSRVRQISAICLAPSRLFKWFAHCNWTYHRQSSSHYAVRL